MSEMPTNRELLRSALTREISSSAAAFCNSIDNRSEYGGNGPKFAQQIRDGVAILIKQIEGDLESLTDDMTPGALLKAMCPRILHTIETKLLDIDSLPNDIKRTIRKHETEIRNTIFHDLKIHPWTRDEMAISSVLNKKIVPKETTVK